MLRLDYLHFKITFKASSNVGFIATTNMLINALAMLLTEDLLKVK